LATMPSADFCAITGGVTPIGAIGCPPRSLATADGNGCA